MEVRKVTPEVERRIEELAGRIEKARILHKQARAQQPDEARKEITRLVLEHNQGTEENPRVTTENYDISLIPVSMGQVPLTKLIQNIFRKVQNPQRREQILQKLFPNQFALSTLETLKREHSIDLPEVTPVTKWRVKIKRRG